MDGVKIGLKEAYRALIITDEKGAITYGIPAPYTDIQQAQVNPRVNRVQVPGDDVISEDLSQCLGADITVQRKCFSVAEEAEALGRSTDTDGGMYGGESDKAPYMAFGYKRTLSNGTGLYVWLLKVKFAPSSSTATTKAPDNITPQYDSLTGSAITRKADGEWIYSIESSDPDFGETFFTQAKLQTLATAASASALSLSSSVPADDAGSVSKTGNIVLTFSNKIAREAISIINTTTGDIVAVTKAFDTAGKVLTLTPMVAMTGTTKHIISVAGVLDIFGQELAITTRDFTTVA